MQDQELRPNNLQPDGTGFAAQTSVKTAETGCSISGTKAAADVHSRSKCLTGGPWCVETLGDASCSIMSCFVERFSISLYALVSSWVASRERYALGLGPKWNVMV
jgi:hypothetical protein